MANFLAWIYLYKSQSYKKLLIMKDKSNKFDHKISFPKKKKNVSPD